MYKKSVLKDWNCEETGNNTEHSLEIETTLNSASVKVKNQETGLFLEVLVEIDKGVPALHIWGVDGGEPIFHAHRNNDGLVVTPEYHTEVSNIQSIFYPGSRSAVMFREEHLCEFCGQRCYEGEGCDEFQAGGFNG